MVREPVPSARQRRTTDTIRQRSIAKGDTLGYDAVELAELTSKARKNLQTGDFAIPSKRAYPIQDKAHARNALARVAQFGTPEEQAQVRSAVARKFPDIGKSGQAQKTSKVMKSVRGGK